MRTRFPWKRACTELSLWENISMLVFLSKTIFTISLTDNLLLLCPNSSLLCIICLNVFIYSKKKNIFHNTLSSHFIKHYKCAKHREKYQYIDKGKTILIWLFFLTSSIFSCILKTQALEHKSKNLENSVKTFFSWWERRQTILINFIDGNFGFIFCGNWIFKYTFTKANLQEHCTKYVQETKEIFYQKKSSGDKWTQAKKAPDMKKKLIAMKRMVSSYQLQKIQQRFLASSGNEISYHW